MTKHLELVDTKHRNINKQKLFIEPLEQRIMLDGAGASTFLDLIDERNQQEIKKSSKNKDIYKEGSQNSTEIPFTTIGREARNDKKNIVFIDSQVKDYREITKSFKKSTEVYLINSNEDGFKRISEILKDKNDINALHLIGHGSVGQIVFGNAFLNNETIDNYKSTLSSIGQSLTTSGDILFYGCNVAGNEKGKLLIKKISEITKADIAASDDVTGKGGDWYLEKNIGIIETKNIQVTDYEHSLLQNGITSINSNVEEKPGATNFKARSQSGSGQRSDSGNDFVLSLESENVSNAGILVLDKDDDGNNNISLNTSNFPVNSYLIFLNDDHSNNERSSIIGKVVFEYEIYGIFLDAEDTIAKTNISKSGATYATSGQSGFSGRAMESFQFYANNSSSSTNDSDWVSIGSDKKTLRIGAKNGNKGDYIRVITAAAPSNTAPVARDDRGVIVENGTLTVSDGANANVSLDNWINTTGEHSGDVIHTSDASRQDTDADGDTLVVSAVRVGGTEGSGTAGTLGQPLTGSFGQLTLNTNGSYTYAADQSAADALDSGDTQSDVFNYTISDGNGGT
ncbi:DUF4347 domain-containing protein, partial [Candidatus Pelagibacter sp.]|nr:DUF4347 domain-containing protein [Candidatus Pelagibacter sp.]